ncbi:hypothetical protein M408DRAFT_21289 [Serendipita vermifera MAFF 305830]|uniref:Uncharacterized protein n=1 Tax=Serendipita vermifera MAFF 305830 TaxID=933852 RepID=A0A0C3BIA4_SERVB|nr:hypothetical protein M408DRAFT_21289 [Serendipita vermifera MAFF 305830]
MEPLPEVTVQPRNNAEVKFFEYLQRLRSKGVCYPLQFIEHLVAIINAHSDWSMPEERSANPVNVLNASPSTLATLSLDSIEACPTPNDYEYHLNNGSFDIGKPTKDWTYCMIEQIVEDAALLWDDIVKVRLPEFSVKYGLSKEVSDIIDEVPIPSGIDSSQSREFQWATTSLNNSDVLAYKAWFHRAGTCTGPYMPYASTDVYLWQNLGTFLLITWPPSDKNTSAGRLNDTSWSLEWCLENLSDMKASI